MSKKHDIVREIEAFISDYATLADPSHVFPIALWIMGTYTFLDFDAFPYITITSATKRSGKTRLSELIGFTCNKPRSFSALSASSLFRTIEAEHPTVIFDEAEQLSSEAQSTLRSVLNTGYRKGQSIPRVGVGGAVEEFTVYCPKVFVLIGDVYDTLKDRSIIIRMVRSDAVKRFVYGPAQSFGMQLRNKIQYAIKEHQKEIVKQFTEHTGLGFLMDRDEEIWTPLFVLAKIFCPDRIQELKIAAIDIATEKTAESRRYINLQKQEARAIDDDYSKRLLVDLYGLMLADRKVISSADAVDALKAIPVAPWRKFRGDGITGREVAKMLSRFGVHPVRIALGSGRGKQTFKRGYKRESLEAAMKHVQ
jgi:hypothetical protein